MQDVEAPRPLVARHDVAKGVVADMAHMDAARGIGKHLEDVVFRQRRILADLEAAPLRPGLLPPSFRFLEVVAVHRPARRSEEHTSELQSLMRISYAVFCLKKKK